MSNTTPAHQRAASSSDVRPPPWKVASNGSQSSHSIPFESLYEGTAHDTAPERGGSVEGTKRNYRRHPKPDQNAPERPPSAYVIFSNKIRDEVMHQNLSFSQIAKIVGDQWQKLDPKGKEPYESQAAAAKESYIIQLSAYKKTETYKEYTQYLADFKANHSGGGGPSEQKKSIPHHIGPDPLPPSFEQPIIREARLRRQLWVGNRSSAEGSAVSAF